MAWVRDRIMISQIDGILETVRVRVGERFSGE